MLVFDLETDGLLSEVTKVHCLCIYDTENETAYTFDSAKDNIQVGINLLAEADIIVGHNVINYDLPVLDKLYGFKANQYKVLDTLVLSRLIYGDLSETDARLIAKGTLDNKLFRSHSLKAWGQRLSQAKSEQKGELDMSDAAVRAQLTPEMIEYCEQDCKVTAKLVKFFKAKKYSEEAIKLEHEVAFITTEMQVEGIKFDVDKAEKLHADLLIAKQELEAKLQETFKPWEESEPPKIAKVNNKKLGRVKGEPYVKTKTVIFNPGSRMHIANRLKELHGWEPKEFTPNGSAKVDEVTLAELDYPEAKLLVEYLTITKRLGQLADGEQAWLKRVEKDGKIHGYINSLGTVSGRASHSYPNLGQVVAVNKPYGRECRELFRAEPGYKLCGADLSGLELRILSGYLAKHDDGKYRDTVLSADVHEANRIAAGLPDRAAAKRFIYCLIFGGGNSKLGETVGGTSEDGAALKGKFFKANPAFKKLVDLVKAFAEKHKYLPGLDDRHLTVRSAHSALNLLIQSAGALIAKRALVIFKQLLRFNGLEDKVKLVLWIHDEFQIQFREDLDEDTIGKLAVQSFKEAGEHYNFQCPITGEYSIGRNWAETH